MLDEVGLIHMNGRVYEPALGRFMSADPMVTYPNRVTSFNRYAYALDNPLRFVDPTGWDPESWGREGRESTPTGTSSGQVGDNGNIAGATAGTSSNTATPPKEKQVTEKAATLGDDFLFGGFYEKYLSAFKEKRYLDATANAIGAIGMGLGNIATFGTGTLVSKTGTSAAKFSLEMVAAKGVLPSTGGVVRQFEQVGDKVYYRVFSGDANVGGWLTSVPP